MGTLELTDDVVDRLVSQAREEHCSVNDLLRKILSLQIAPLPSTTVPHKHSIYRDMLENYDGSAWAIDSHFQLLAGNNRFMCNFRKAFGHTPEPGDNLFQIGIPPEIERDWRAYFTRGLAGESFAIEILSRFTSEEHEVEFRFRPIKASDGQITGITIFARNITARKRAEDKLRRTEANLRAMLNSSLQSFTLIDREYRIIDAAEAGKKNAEAIFGRQMEPGDSIFDFVLDRDKASFSANYLRAVNGERVTIEKSFPTLQGKTLYFEVSYYPVVDANRETIGICMAFQDVTERKQSQLALSQSETRLRSLLETQTAYVVRSDINGIYTYCNPAFAERYRWFSENLIGRSLLETVKPEDHEKALNAAKTCLAEPGRKVQVILQKLTSEQEVFWTLWEFIAIPGIEPSATEIQCIGFDITEQIQAVQLRLEQERLKASLKKEREFNTRVQKVVSALSHDIRTPLNVISNARYILERHFDRIDEQQRHQKLESINRQLHYVQLLLNDLSLTVKGSLEDHLFQPANLNLAALCKVIIEELQHSIGSQHVMHFVSDGQIQTAWIDETLVSRILLNLFSNAIKFSPESSLIELHLYRRDTWIVLSVVDHGMGVSDKDMEHIFEPFYRSDTVESIHGTGLGLNIVQDCVNRHQGHISVTSRIGEGTTFTIELPLHLS